MAAPSPHSASERSTLSPGQPNDSRKRKFSGPGDNQPIREYGLMRDTGEHDTARFVGSSSGIHFIRNVHLRLARRSADRTQGQNANELIPGEDDQLRRQATSRDGAEKYLWRDHEVAAETPGEGNPSFDQLVEWSKSYFESWHPVLPFLHGPDVLHIFEQASKSGAASLHHLDRSILRSVLSISLADSRQGTPFREPIPQSLLFGTVEEAMSSSQFALYQPASIYATQAALSIQLFLISMLCLNAASRLGGLIVRMAFHLGLHRCPSRFPFFTSEQAAKRRRVFWCLYSSERLLCQSLGLPLDIRDDDIDVCFPGEENHGPSAPDHEDKRLQLLKLTAKHARIRGLILELRNKAIVSRQDTADRAISVQAELAKWSNGIQDLVEGGDGDSSDAEQPLVSSSHRLMLLLLKYESTISLNRPMMASDPSTPSYSAALQACISAAKSICIAMKLHVSQNKVIGTPSGRTLSAPMLWPSFTWSIWISAFVLVYAAFEGQVPLDSALRHVRSSKDSLSHIASRNTSWPEYCLSAIDELTSAVEELGAARHGGMRQDTRTTSGLQPAPGAQARPSDDNRANSSPVVTSSGGLPYVAPPPRRQYAWQADTEAGPSASSPARGYAPPALASNGYQHTPNTPQSFGQTDSDNVAMPAYGAFGSSTDLMPVEGQESMVWYDQLFASSFSAIDDPLLAAAQFDPSIDPTWSYLR